MTRRMTVARYEEIRRRLAEGRGIREIARALGCSRITVREVRDGLRGSPAQVIERADPPWMLQLDWPSIVEELGMGHPMKLIWEEKAEKLTTYSNFWKQFYRKFPEYRSATSTARDFSGGERVEVDWAGDPLEWIDVKTGEIHRAWVFVAGLGFSQLAFARATAERSAASRRRRNIRRRSGRCGRSSGSLPTRARARSRSERRAARSSDRGSTAEARLRCARRRRPCVRSRRASSKR